MKILITFLLGIVLGPRLLVLPSQRGAFYLVVEGLSTTPVIDYRTYTDLVPTGDLHMIGHQFSTRARLINANGNSANHVMKIGGKWDFDKSDGDLADIFAQMDAWLVAIKNSPSCRFKSARSCD